MPETWLAGRKYYYFEGAFSLFLLVAILVHMAVPLPAAANRIFLASVATLGILPVVWSAYQAIRAREITVDILAGIALVFSLIGREWSSAVFIALMLSAARVLTHWNNHRTDHNLQGLMKLRPEQAKVRRPEGIVTIAVEALVPGDILLCEVGGRIPVDGTVVTGIASLNEASLTGESLPVEKKVGSAVYSSTLVVEGSLEVRAEKVGSATTLERIITLVKQAREDKPAISTAAEKFGKWYIILIFSLSAVIWFWTGNLSLVLAIALVVCADDVAIAIPLAYISAIGAAARQGVVIKGGRYLEALGRTTTVIFDKTGTLTKGALAVEAVQVFDGQSPEQLVRIAASLAARSTHPMSRAVMRYAESLQVKPADVLDFEEVSGNGLRGRLDGTAIQLGKERFLREALVDVPDLVHAAGEHEEQEGRSVLMVANDKRVIGMVSVVDAIRAGASALVAELKQAGVERIVMLTGDNERVAGRIARAAGVTEYHAALSPEDKLSRVEALTRGGAVTVMIGDGVNDAASLERATVGIAMGAIGYDAAIDSANIVLMHDDLSKIPELIQLSRLLHRVVKQDFWIWGGSNIVGLGLVFTGLIGPTGAAAYNFLSDFIPLLNSLKVTRVRLGDGR